MGIRIKLRREGQIRSPMYKVVVLPAKKGISSKPIEVLGFWKILPGKPSSSSYLVLDWDKLAVWVSRGAQLSKRLEKLLVKSYR